MTLEKIAAFQKEYQGSAEEREDVLRAYVDCQGKMARVIDCVMLATDGASARRSCVSCVVWCAYQRDETPTHRYTYTYEVVARPFVKSTNDEIAPHPTLTPNPPYKDDEPRFRELIEAAITAKEVPRFKGFKAQVKGDAKRAAKASKVGEWVGGSHTCLIASVYWCRCRLPPACHAD